MTSPDTPTLRDVAAAAGVAVATASYALNGKGRIDTATRTRIREIAQRIGYQANRSAQNLRSGRTTTLGLMLPSPAELTPAAYLNFDWYGRMATAAAQAAFHADHSLLLLPSTTDPNALRHAKVDGVLIINPMTDDQRPAVLTKIGIPCVAVGSAHTTRFRFSTSPDLTAATHALLNHLTDRGATNILVLNPGLDSEWTRATTNAYLKWCRVRGAAPRISDEPASFPGADTIEHVAAAAYSATHTALTSQNPPDAVLSLAFGCAPAAARAALDLGLTIPGDVLIAQDRDEPALLTSDPPITAVDFFPAEHATTAVQTLLTLLNGDTPAARSHTHSELRIRASTTPPPSP
ncbi:LacI family DNA-binding transcriptional regulator [Rhodococcus qingshengii]|uniref:LacI family DNA-binding transcriptional regulator n=1 Tax=Rhodococcus qingshengii TaxID=334542 RepID=UPI001BE5D945|nr:LacI family DNA-binding transcriptional regulator [Rhodococcus qingshengii]MBT2272187.1 LacI family DNA-binding transcriptional regulator [Rhodococcus qingshengii]